MPLITSGSRMAASGLTNGTNGHATNGVATAAPSALRPRTFSLKKVSDIFAQYFFRRHFVSDIALNRFIEALKLRTMDPNTVDKCDLITRFNRKVREFGFQIRTIEDDFSNNTFYIFCNNIDDNISKQKVFPLGVSKLFFLIIKEIVTAFLDNEGEPETIRPYIKFENALELWHQMGSEFTRKAARKFISGWCRDFYFRRVKTGNLALGVRTLVEFSTYLKQTYGLLACHKCDLVCVVGINCVQCNQIHHRSCCVRFDGDNIGCPTCNTFLPAERILPPPVEAPEDVEASQI